MVLGRQESLEGSCQSCNEVRGWAIGFHFRLSQGSFVAFRSVLKHGYGLHAQGLSTLLTLGPVLPCCGGCLGPCRMFSRIPISTHLVPEHALPQHDNPKCLQTLPTLPLGANLFPREYHWPVVEGKGKRVHLAKGSL